MLGDYTNGESTMSNTDTCTNVNCEKDATVQVQFSFISAGTYGYCDEHYAELKGIERAEMSAES